jgi:ABC-type phosphate/phosphonate transport system permease subunit
MENLLEGTMLLAIAAMLGTFGIGQYYSDTKQYDKLFATMLIGLFVVIFILVIAIVILTTSIKCLI